MKFHKATMMTHPLLPPALTAALSLALALPALADTRTLAGAITYFERIALPEGSLLMVEALDEEERALAALRVPTDGAQVPLAFALEVPADQLLTLRAGLRWPDGALWLTLPQGVVPGEDDLDLGEIRARHSDPMGFASLLRCGDSLLEFGIIPEGARLRGGDGVWLLEAAPAASGARFEDPQDADTWVWSRGESALVSIAGEELPECSLLSSQADLVQLWDIRTLNGAPVSAPEDATIGFTPDGRVSAGLGCNRMIGSYTRHGGMLDFRQMASTLMACPDDLAAEERKLVEGLASVDGYRLDDAGALVLTARGAPVLEAAKVSD